ncbi:MAG TPA: hypothetical protein VEK08_00370 [Planctomycetota bacterium]|nr:hypothetical protein [Planctomycetota bacterium]
MLFELLIILGALLYALWLRRDAQSLSNGARFQRPWLVRLALSCCVLLFGYMLVVLNQMYGAIPTWQVISLNCALLAMIVAALNGIVYRVEVTVEGLYIRGLLTTSFVRWKEIVRCKVPFDHLQEIVLLLDGGRKVSISPPLTGFWHLVELIRTQVKSENSTKVPP